MDHPSSSHCPRCGAALDQWSVDGLCAKCLGALNFTADTALPGEAAAAIPPPTPEEIAAHFPQLEIIAFLGRGGMGVVYKARQKSLGRLVALKLLAPERVSDPKFAERFAHEAKALAALSHPNIVTIHDFGQAGGYFYLLMEFVDGVNLRQAMKTGRFTPEQALAIVPPVCEALQYAHDHGIVHRDIKPENLLLDRQGRVKIADFGIAKILGEKAEGTKETGAPAGTGSLTQGATLGTPQYSAPEQRTNSGKVDHRADIYSLGVVLYELLTGELPGTKLQPPSSRLRGMQIDVRLDEIVLRALEVKPELRFATVADFRTEVETLATTPLGRRGGGAGVSFGAARSRPGVRRFLAITCAMAVVIVGLALLAWYLFSSPTPTVTLSYTPVRLERNVVILDLQTMILRGPVEVQLTLEGPALPADGMNRVPKSKDLAEDTEVITPAHDEKGRRVRTLKLSITTWRAAFVLPNESLAKAVWEDLRPLGPLEIRADKNTAGTLFEVATPQGETYSGHFIVRSIRSQLGSGASRLDEARFESRLTPSEEVKDLSRAASAQPQPPKLPDSAYTRTGLPVAAIKWHTPPSWGEAKGGLQAGIRVNGEARIGGAINVELWVQNVGPQDLKFRVCGRTDVGLRVIAKDSTGKDHDAEITSFDAIPFYQPLELPPGHLLKPKEFKLRFDVAAGTGPPAQTASFHLPPGDFKLRVRWSDSHAMTASEDNWTGELTSGEVDVKLASELEKPR